MLIKKVKASPWFWDCYFDWGFKDQDWIISVLRDIEPNNWNEYCLFIFEWQEQFSYLTETDWDYINISKEDLDFLKTNKIKYFSLEEFKKFKNWENPWEGKDFENDENILNYQKEYLEKQKEYRIIQEKYLEEKKFDNNFYFYWTIFLIFIVIFQIIYILLKKLKKF